MDKKMMKVLSPVAGKENNKTHWMRAGVAYENKDGSINIYLDLLPTNGKLQLREFEESDRRLEGGSRSSGAGSAFNGGGAAQASNAELPF
jgi:hypothetical protein